MSSYKTRTIENKLDNLIGQFPVIMIKGPRQVGKTTLLNHLLVTEKGKNINYVSLDNILIRNQAKEDPELFLRSHETPLIIDEFQYVPELLSYIKIKVDEARKEAMFGNLVKVDTMYYLTGSQIFEAMETTSESLAGRVAILNLYGLSTRELNNLKENVFIPDIAKLKNKEKVKKLSTNKLFERIINGSYPEVIIQKNDVEMFYQSYINTYIERDIRKLINVKDENKFLKFISSVAVRTSQEYNALDIAKDIEVDSKTVDQWMSVLVNTHLVYLLQSYSNNNIQKVIKRPKIYFMDTGLACYLTGYFNSETLEKSIYNGAIFETYVISEIIKTYTNNGIDPRNRLFYYRDNNKKEIDLLIINDNKVYPVEIKKSANPGKKAIKNFDVLKDFNLDIGTGSVICMISEILAIDENNYYVPIEYI